MMAIEFFMAMNPPTVTHQEHKVTVINGKPVFYDPPELKAARLKLIDNLAAHRKRGQKKLEGPVALHCIWCFPVTGDHENGEYRTSKPDTDNLQKLIKDCMTVVGFWKDDAQVVREIVEKFWADIPGIYVCAEEIGEKGLM